MTITRRTLLRAGGALLASSTVGGCAYLKQPKPICPFDPRFTDPDSLLTIDAHCHIFNATDLQIRRFIELIAVRQGGGMGTLAEVFGELLQSFGWRTAPDVATEMDVLARLKPAIMACDTQTNLTALSALRQSKYEKGRTELREAANARAKVLSIEPLQPGRPMTGMPADIRGLQQILELPDTYDELFRDPPKDGFESEAFTQRVTINSALKFIIEMLQYRFVSVYNYLETYDEASPLKIDLMTPALVDFDWWLNGGTATKSSLPDQMALMKEISILTGGRVHAMVPFDPYRQVVHDLGMASGFSPIELVKKSVSEYGAIGIKLYPPMGFAPYGNEQVGYEKPQLWKRPDWLTDVARRDDFPKRLDASLEKLYEYCSVEGVPVMGHANESNGPTEEFEALTAPTHWRSAASGFSNVSFCFGHFGGVGSENEPGQSTAAGFLKLMQADQSAGRVRLRADASYFSNVLDRPKALAEAMEALYNYGSNQPGPALDRLMYGADWKMLVAEANSSGYLTDFDRVISELERELGTETRLKSKFFGQNAADFLGLRQGQANRLRLAAFYERNGVTAKPLWMKKIDGRT